MADEQIVIDILGSTSPFEQALNRAINSIYKFTNLVGESSTAQLSSARLAVEGYNQVAKSIKQVLDLGEKLSAQQKRMNALYDAGTKQATKMVRDAAQARINAESGVADRTRALLERTSAHQKTFYERERQMFIANAKAFEAAERQKAQIRMAMYQDEKAHASQFSNIATLLAGIGTRGRIGSLLTGVATATGAGSQLAGLAAMLPGILTGIGAIIVAVQALKVAWEGVKAAASLALSIGREGLMYNDQIENTKIAVAGLVLSYFELKGATDKWAAASQIASGIMEQLQDVALRNKITLAPLARAFQEGFGPMAKTGLTDMTKLVAVTERFVQLGAALRVPTWNLGQEIRGFMSGDTNERVSRIAAAVSRMLPTGNIKEWMAQFETAEEMFDEFLRLTEALGEAGRRSMMTLTGAASEMKEGLEQALGLGTRQMYNDLKIALLDLADTFIVVGENGKKMIDPEIVQGIRSLYDNLNEAYRLGRDFANFFLHTKIDSDNMFGGLVEILKGLTELIKLLSKVKDNALIILRTYTALGWVSPGSEEITMKGLKPPTSSPQDLTLSPGVAGALGLNPDATDKPAPGYGEDIGKIFSQYAESLYPPSFIDLMKEEAKKVEEARKKSIEQYKKAKEARLKAIEAQGAIELKYAMKMLDFEQDWAAALKKTADGVLGKMGWRSPSYTAARNRVDARIEGRTEEEKKLGQEIAQEFLAKLQQSNEQFADAFTRPVADMFIGFATKGGKGFAEAAYNGMQRMLTKGADSLAGMLADFVTQFMGGGTLGTTAEGVRLLNGKPITEQEFQRLSAQQQQNRKIASQGAMYAQIGVGSYYTARMNPEGGQTAGLTQGFMAGAATGNIYAAIAGAIIGWIGGLVGKLKAQDAEKYAIPTIDASGRAGLERPDTYRDRRWTGWLPNRGQKRVPNTVTDVEAENMINSVQETFDKFWSGYMQLALKVGATLPTLEEITGRFAEGPSKDFMDKFQLWLEEGLPDIVMGQFFDTLSIAYQELGMSADRFKEVFDKFDELDPEKALELLNVVADTLRSFKNYTDFAQDIGGYENSGFNFQAGIIGQQDRRSYAAQIHEADKEIVRVAESIGKLTGEAQIRQAGELARLLDERVAKEKELMRQFNAFLDDSSKSFDALRRELTLEGMTNAEGQPDYEGQMEYLRGYLQEIMTNIANATSLEELQYWQGEFFNTTGQMRGIAAQMGPEAQAAFRDWLMGPDGQSGVLGMAQQAIEATVTRWGEDIARRNNDLFGTIQPVINQFTQGMTDAGGSAGNAADELDRLPAPIQRTIDAFDDLEGSIRGLEQALSGISAKSAPNAAAVNKSGNAGFESRVVSNRTKQTGRNTPLAMKG